MKKLILLFALTICSLFSYSQIEGGYEVYGDENIYGTLWTQNGLELGTFWVRVNADSTWLEKPYGTWIAPLSNSNTLFERKISKSEGYLTWTGTTWSFLDESYEPTLTKDDLTEITSSILTITGGTDAVIGSGTTIEVAQSGVSTDGYLSSTDWGTFNGKQDVLSLGDISESTSDVLSITGGTGAVVGSGVTVEVDQASTSTSGYLSSTDWNTFNGKANAETYETVSRIIYVTTTGNDVTGDGTVGNPFANPLRAYQDIKDVIPASVTITIDVELGTYTVDMLAIEDELRSKIFLSRSGLIVNGKKSTVQSGLTLTAHSPEAYIYDVTGATFTANQHQDRFLFDGTNYYPIVYNGTTTVNTTIGAAAATSIIENTVNFTLSSASFYYRPGFTPQIGNTFEFNNINFTYAGILGFYNNMTLDIIGCKITANSVTGAKDNLRNNFKGCAFVLSTAGITLNGASYQLSSTSLRKSGSKAGTALSIQQNFTNANVVGQRGLYLYNWATGIVAQQGNFQFNITSSGLVLDNITTGMTIRNNSNIQFTAFCPIYLSTVTTLLSNGEILESNYILFIKTLVGIPTTYASSGITGNGYVNHGKNICISIPGVYPEIENKLSATLTDNTTTDIIMGLTTQNTAIWIEYRIVRSTGNRVGRIQLMYDGTYLYASPDEFITNGIAGVNETAIVFSPYLDGTFLKLRATLSSTGSNATISYNVSRTMI